MHARRPSILVLDDHPIVGLGVRRVLEGALDVEDVTVLSSVGAFEAYSRPWDVMVLDLKLADGNGVDVLANVVERYPGRPVIIYSVLSPRQIGVRALRKGACSYISKSDEPELLVRAVKSALDGKRFVTPELAELLINEQPGSHSLTDREAEIIRLMADGSRPSDIASTLGLSRSTVSGHLSRARTKLDVDSNIDLVRVFENGHE